MCRSIKVLRSVEPPATHDDISAAALQFVRKVSGYRKPSRANEQVFNRALVEIAGSVERLLTDLSSTPAKQSKTTGQSQHRAADQP
ncbi:MAG: DUF2277 domain-containing protein [Bryobacteraceae bacterium]|jgi:hypothetical protein